MKNTLPPIQIAGSQLCESRHVCAFFNSEDEKYRVLLPFIKDGFECGDKAVHVVNPDHTPILIASSAVDHERSGRFRAGEQVRFSFSFENVLAPGRYIPVISLAHRGSGVQVIDRFESSSSFMVTGSRSLGGLVDIPVEVAIDRPDLAVAEQLSA